MSSPFVKYQDLISNPLAEIPSASSKPRNFQAHTFYSILFKLPDKPISYYVDMLQLQLRAMIKTKMLTDDDRYILMTDASCAEVVKTLWLPKQFRMMLVPPIKTVYEGMRLKYLFPYFVSPPLHGNDVAVYLDLDILPIREAKFFSIPPDTIALVPEGDPQRPDYAGDRPLIGLPAGVTAGFFAYRWGQRLHALFQELLKRLDAGPKDYYTLDQPHFNHLMATINFKAFLPQEMLSFNGHGNLGQAHFINFAGEPGNAEFHWRKLLRFYITTFS